MSKTEQRIAAHAQTLAQTQTPDFPHDPEAFELERRAIEESLDIRPPARTPVPDEAVYPRLGDSRAMSLVYRDYMSGKDLDKAAAAHGVCARTAYKWAHRGRWVRMRCEIESVAADEEARKLQKLRIEKRIPELEKQIDASSKLRDAVTDALDGENSPGQLMQLGTALKAAGDVTVRALGVNDAGATGAERDEKDQKAPRAPLVVVFPGGGLPPVRPTKNVEEIK